MRSWRARSADVIAVVGVVAVIGFGTYVTVANHELRVGLAASQANAERLYEQLLSEGVTPEAERPAEVVDDALAGGTGVAGERGFTGDRGVSGPAGDVGLTGVAGADGSAGATGADGTAGATGVTGATGTPGATGESVVGPTGATGPAGVDGAAGAAGAAARGIASIDCIDTDLGSDWIITYTDTTKQTIPGPCRTKSNGATP